MIIQLLQLSFVQRALFAGFILGLLFAVLGVFVILRKMAFWGDGIAHASLAGVAFALLFSFQPMIWAIVVSIIFAIMIFYLEKKTNLSNDTLIGVLFTSFMALGVIILSFSNGYQPELISFLFGDILTITIFDIYLMLIVSIIVLTFIKLNYKNLTLMTLDKESAYIAGVKTELLELLFYIALAVSVVVGVKVLGVVLVSALLIIPASIAKVLANSFSLLKKLTILFSEIIIIVGMLISLQYNLPSGPTIILFGALLLLLVSLFIKK